MIQIQSNLITTCKTYATVCHNSTNHRYDENKPYTFHLEMVEGYGQEYKHLLSDDEIPIAIASCWTHDVIEDTRQTFNDVQKVCGKDIADITYRLTNEKGRNREERANDKYYQGIKESKIATFVKICDRLANVCYARHGNRMLDRYRKEYNHFHKKLGHIPEFEVMFMDIESLLTPRRL